MARQPQVIPFAEGKPADTLQVEELNENEVLVGDPALDAIPERDETFDTTNANGTTLLVRGVGCKLLTNIKTRTATMGDAMELTRQFIGTRQLF